MWECPLCNRIFKNNHQSHFCADKSVGDFLTGKSDSSLALFDYFISKFEEIGPIKLYATKSMVVIAADIGFAYVINLGKSFVDVVLPFKELHEDNLCFRKMALVPGSNDYNHHLRIMYKEDINEEVFEFMKKAYAKGKNV
ncbi:DUF5655 domain-containing protein [Pedobacter frigiditerrae]|uniref:DUF5655 domain-containing protein n=1 Tax=Pedobacter frigiditerrae TaxID=2530452 RepID=UPI00292D4AD7|nr:DUF5655 domain-containing protein [Pedobacter frigiditerrae]